MPFRKPKIYVWTVAFSVRTAAFRVQRDAASDARDPSFVFLSQADEARIRSAVDGWVCDLVIYSGLNKRLCLQGQRRLPENLVMKEVIEGLVLAYEENASKDAGVRNIETMLRVLERQYAEALRQRAGGAGSERSDTVRLLFEECFPGDDADGPRWRAFAAAFVEQNKGLVPFIDDAVRDCRPVVA